MLGYAEPNIELEETDEYFSFYRTIPHNALLVSNVIENLRHTSKSMSFLAIGRGHEVLLPKLSEYGEQHPLPFSDVLCYSGDGDVNVIVVDTAQAFKPDKVMAYSLAERVLEERVKEIGKLDFDDKEIREEWKTMSSLLPEKDWDIVKKDLEERLR